MVTGSLVKGDLYFYRSYRCGKSSIASALGQGMRPAPKFYLPHAKLWPPQWTRSMEAFLFWAFAQSGAYVLVILD